MVQIFMLVYEGAKEHTKIMEALSKYRSSAISIRLFSRTRGYPRFRKTKMGHSKRGKGSSLFFE